MAWGVLASSPSRRDGVITPTRNPDGSRSRWPRLENKIRVPSFGAVLIGCHFGGIPQTPATWPSTQTHTPQLGSLRELKLQTANVVPLRRALRTIFMKRGLVRAAMAPGAVPF